MPASGRPIYHVRHDSTEAQSHYRPGQPGHEFKAEAMPNAGEAVIAKRTNSAFIGTDLESRLRVAGEDACFTFGRKDWSAVWRTADEVHAMSLANLSGEYATVIRTAEVLGGLGSSRRQK